MIMEMVKHYLHRDRNVLIHDVYEILSILCLLKRQSISLIIIFNKILSYMYIPKNVHCIYFNKWFKAVCALRAYRNNILTRYAT